MSAFGDSLGAAFQKRQDLQTAICNFIRRVSTQTSAAIRHYGESDGTGFDEQGMEDGNASDVDGVNDDTRSRASAYASTSDAVPNTFTLPLAQQRRECLRSTSGKWMPELLNRYVALPPQQRGGVGSAINAFATVLSDSNLAPFFKEALTKVVAALKVIQVCMISDLC